ncbi:MAG: hypothetical protein Q6L60_09590 [Thermostichus sp. HHBFW_bins_43]
MSLNWKLPPFCWIACALGCLPIQSIQNRIVDVQLEPGEHLYVRCSGVDRVYALGRPTEYRSVAEQGLTEAKIDSKGWRSPYLRVLVRDHLGGKAWSNPIWLD